MGKYSKLAKSAETDLNRVKLVFISGKYSGGEFFIYEGQKLVIGRDISSDIAIVDSKVSRNHASITYRDGQIFIEDHHSTNGTYLNGEKISPSEAAPVPNGSKIKIGDSVISVGDSEADSSQIENKIETSFKENSYTLGRGYQEVTIPNTKTSTQSKKLSSESAAEEEPFTLDNSVKVASSSSEEEKVAVGKLNLKKTSQSEMDKIAIADPERSSTGCLSAIDIVDLLKILSQSTSSGYLSMDIVSPFEEKIEITIGASGIVACKCMSGILFSQEKALSRALLAKDGEYSFKIDEILKNEKVDANLRDLFAEICNQQETLLKYRKIVNFGQLKFLIPIKGKLSDLSKQELESLQFMINAQEVMNYLNKFTDNDDFILLSEILKYVDLGFLQKAKEEDEEELLDDIFDMK